MLPDPYDERKYIVTFFDGFPSVFGVYIIKSKDEVKQCFTDNMNLLQLKFNPKIADLRCDNEGEIFQMRLNNCAGKMYHE